MPKISALPSGTLSATEEFAVNDSGTTKKVTLATPLSNIATNTTNIATNTTNIATNTTNITTLQNQVVGILPPRTPFVPGDFAAWSSGSPTETVTGTVVNYALASNATLTHRIKVKNINAQQTYTAMFQVGQFWDGDFDGMGICFFEAGTNKVAAVDVERATSTSYTVRKGTLPTTFTSRQAMGTPSTRPNILFFRLIINTSGNLLTYAFGFDGYKYNNIATESLTTFFTTAPDKVGLYMFNSCGFEVDFNILSWIES